jgi:hypothetical protein
MRGFPLTGSEAHDLFGADHLLPRTLLADKALDASGSSTGRSGWEIAVVSSWPIANHPASVISSSTVSAA